MNRKERENLKAELLEAIEAQEYYEKYPIDEDMLRKYWKMAKEGHDIDLEPTEEGWKYYGNVVKNGIPIIDNTWLDEISFGIKQHMAKYAEYYHEGDKRWKRMIVDWDPLAFAWCVESGLDLVAEYNEQCDENGNIINSRKN